MTEGPAPDARRPEIIGHRGYAARFPENTLPGLEGALDAGCRSLEWDLHVSSDGVPVLFHDDTLDRTTDGTGPVREHTLPELRELDAGGWFGPAFQGTRIPTLVEALDAVAGRVERIFPEVKRVRTPGDLGTILGDLRAAGLHSRTVLISLDHALLAEARLLDSAIRLGWVVEREEDMAGAIEAVVADGRALLDPGYRLLLDDPARTRDLVARGVPLATWTVDRVAEAEALRELGVLAITTNRVGELMAWARK